MPLNVGGCGVGLSNRGFWYGGVESGRTILCGLQTPSLAPAGQDLGGPGCPGGHFLPGKTEDKFQQDGWHVMPSMLYYQHKIIVGVHLAYDGGGLFLTGQGNSRGSGARTVDQNWRLYSWLHTNKPRMSGDSTSSGRTPRQHQSSDIYTGSPYRGQRVQLHSQLRAAGGGGRGGG